jgi:hypothetical protein
MAGPQRSAGVVAGAVCGRGRGDRDAGTACYARGHGFVVIGALLAVELVHIVTLSSLRIATRPTLGNRQVDRSGTVLGRSLLNMAAC